MKRDDPFTGELRTMTAYMDNPYFKPIRDLFLTAKGNFLRNFLTSRKFPFE